MSLGSLLLNWRRTSETVTPATPKTTETTPAVEHPVSAAQRDFIPDERLSRELRYAVLLGRDSDESVDPRWVTAAWESIDNDMALIPAGHITLGVTEVADPELEQPTT